MSEWRSSFDTTVHGSDLPPAPAPTSFTSGFPPLSFRFRLVLGTQAGHVQPKKGKEALDDPTPEAHAHAVEAPCPGFHPSILRSSSRLR